MVRAFFVRKIIIPVALMVAYIVALVAGFRYLALWTPSNLTATILWAISVALVAFFNINSNIEDEHYFRKAALEQIQLLVIVEFVVGFYTFDLWLELIIIPIAALIGGLLAVAESDARYKPVKRLLDSVLVVAGLGLILFSLYKISTDFASFASSSTLRDFVLFPLMSLSFLPFIYIIALWVRYEILFIRLSFFIKDPSLLRFAKKETILQVNFRLNLLNRWARKVALLRLTTKEDVLKALADTKAQQGKREVATNGKDEGNGSVET